jgi:hypothetical protein
VKVFEGVGDDANYDDGGDSTRDNSSTGEFLKYPHCPAADTFDITDATSDSTGVGLNDPAAYRA